MIQRALEWAEQRHKRDAAVVGAVIDPGECLDLTTREGLELVKAAYESFASGQSKAGLPLPVNGWTKLLRHLDCAVIRHLHQNLKDAGEPPIDTVRGLFPEGDPAYPGAGFDLLTHTQIAVCTPAMIKGVFRPR